jgi:hypothetical protein
MPESAIGTNTCSLCNASYESHSKLREHQRMAHRGRGNEERTQAAAVDEQLQQSEDRQT